mmetsp:Transcript_26119/g.37467  ORF Transcript_26119/g.37467 Transcript_26119/m.37467 type:complete len:595 (+) Transcript_26119:2042-3826(+)
MGIIPLVLQDIISQFATELGRNHSPESKKEFLQQWHQVHAAALLRAISITMAAGAQVAEYKTTLLPTLPDFLSPSMLAGTTVSQPKILHDSQASKRITPGIRQPQQPATSPILTKTYFECTGISCSVLFISKTNLRPNTVCKQPSVCRRCSTMNTAIECAISIEQTLAADNAIMLTFINTAWKSTNISIDSIAHAISMLNPLPKPFTPTSLQRSTKRNVFPILTSTTIRTLCGTFSWRISDHPTSLDLAFNQLRHSTADLKPTLESLCTCNISAPTSSLDSASSCSYCGKSSPYTSTATRLHIFQTMQAAQQCTYTKATIPKKNLKSRATLLTHRHENKENDPTDPSHSIKRLHAPSSYVTPTSLPIPSNLLQDITNLPNRTSIRPHDNELHQIIQLNHMLLNFVVSYFFTILAQSFKTVLYTEFLFDFVKGAGSWKQFVTNCTTQGHYTTLFTALQQRHSICIVPICHQLHWTILVRKFIGNAWKIFFIDSLEHGSDQRFSQWQELFQDDELFSGVWTKVKIIKQTELECGARACLHGVCFALSPHPSAIIMNKIHRIKNLSTRSRLMVSKICTDGHWTPQGWLRQIIEESPT